MSVGALKGPWFLVPAVLLSSIAMAGEAVAFLLWKAKDFGGPLPFLMLMAQEHKQGLELEKRTTVVWVPYGVGIAAGTLVALATGWTPLAG